MNHPPSFPLDTTEEASRIQYAAWRRMGQARRSLIATELSDNLRQTAADGVRSRHPHYTPEQIRLAVARLFLGSDLFAKAYPGANVEP